MAKKRSKATIRKRTQPPGRWGVYLLTFALLLAVLVSVGAADQMLATSASPEPTAAASSAAGVSNSVRTQYVFGDQLRPLVEVTGGVRTLNIYRPSNQIIAQVAPDGLGSEEVRYLLADHLGSTRAALDGDGDAVARFEYGPYGETAAEESAAAELRYRYTGHPWDESQALYETPARGYDPTVGRFLSVDPQRQDASPYVYAGNNPVGFVDPTGGGEVPFFVYTGYTKTGVGVYSNSSHKARAIGLQFGLDGTTHQRVLSADMFNTGGGGVSSYAEMHAGTTMLGRVGSSRGYTYNGKMYWIVGGEENVHDMGRLKEGIAAFRSHLEDFPSEVTILNFSGDKKTGTDLRDKLRSLSLDPLVVDTEQHGEWKEDGRGMRWKLQGFTSDGKIYRSNDFVKYVHDLEKATLGELRVKIPRAVISDSSQQRPDTLGGVGPGQPTSFDASTGQSTQQLLELTPEETSIIGTIPNLDPYTGD